MKTKFSVALAIGAMTFSAASSPVLMAEKVHAQPEQTISEYSPIEAKDVVQSTELEGVRCTPLLRILGFC